MFAGGKIAAPLVAGNTIVLKSGVGGEESIDELISYRPGTAH